MNLEPYYQQCLNKLLWATKELGFEVSHQKLSKIAKIIVYTMTGPWRFFHTPDHIFEVGGSSNPIEILAALFHDLVYVQVDCSINFNISYYLAPFITEAKESLLIRERDEISPDSIFELVMYLFDFSFGEKLPPFLGQNEFLSAVIAAKALEEIFNPKIIAKIVSLIEATIPFRPKTKDGLTPLELLYQRLKEANYKFNLGFLPEEIDDTILQAVSLSNRDVGGFASINSVDFLDNTWNLIPETNHNLLNYSSYTIAEYRIAIIKMEGFLNFLSPEVIFQRFKGFPDDKFYSDLIKRATKNLQIGRLYLASKVVSITVLESLSYRFGRDIPLAMMMGEMPQTGVKLSRLVDFIPMGIDNFYPLQNDLEKEVLQLLEIGRNQTSNYDLKESPLATLIVKYIGFDKVKNLRILAQDLFDHKINSEAFLANFHPELIKIIVDGVCQLMECRKILLSEGNINNHN